MGRQRRSVVLHINVVVTCPPFSSSDMLESLLIYLLIDTL